MERVEAAKKQLELAASSEDPEAPELLGLLDQQLGPKALGKYPLGCFIGRTKVSKA